MFVTRSSTASPVRTSSAAAPRTFVPSTLSAVRRVVSPPPTRTAKPTAPPTTSSSSAAAPLANAGRAGARRDRGWRGLAAEPGEARGALGHRHRSRLSSGDAHHLPLLLGRRFPV